MLPSIVRQCQYDITPHILLTKLRRSVIDKMPGAIMITTKTTPSSLEQTTANLDVSETKSRGVNAFVTRLAETITDKLVERYGKHRDGFDGLVVDIGVHGVTIRPFGHVDTVQVVVFWSVDVRDIRTISIGTPITEELSHQTGMSLYGNVGLRGVPRLGPSDTGDSLIIVRQFHGRDIMSNLGPRVVEELQHVVRTEMVRFGQPSAYRIDKVSLYLDGTAGDKSPTIEKGMTTRFSLYVELTTRGCVGNTRLPPVPSIRLDTWVPSMTLWGRAPLIEDGPE